MVAPAASSEVVVRSSAPTWYSGPQASPSSALREAELQRVRHVLPGQVGVREHDALRPSSRSRGVHQAVHVVARRRHRVCDGRSRAHVREGRPAVRRTGREAHPHQVAVETCRRGVGQRQQRLVADERAGARVLEDVAHLGRGQPPVDRHGDGAQVVGGEERLEELGTVVREQRHDVARTDAAPGQAARQCGHPAGHLCIGDGCALEDRHDGVGRAFGVVGEHGVPVHVGGIHR